MTRFIYLIVSALLFSSCTCTSPVVDSAEERAEQDIVCVVIRTYHKHGNKQTGSLSRLIESLQRQHHRRWEALLVIMDSTPFSDLRTEIRQFDDSRIWVYADWIGPSYAPKDEKGDWSAWYHNELYELSDEAIQACPPQTKWVVVTNGDNEYHDDAFAYLDNVDADIVGWDMYSRYQRPSGIPCERFQTAPDAAPCKPNRLKWCHTDLGAIAYNWDRWVSEDRRYGSLDESGSFTGQDGVMAADTIADGWVTHRVPGRCLFNQGPNPQMCARAGGVWDERTAGKSFQFGGSCISKEAAAVAILSPSVEALDITLTHDGAFSGFGGPVTNFTIQCLRPAENYRYMLTRAFPPPCAEAVDAHLHTEMAAAK